MPSELLTRVFKDHHNWGYYPADTGYFDSGCLDAESPTIYRETIARHCCRGILTRLAVDGSSFGL